MALGSFYTYFDSKDALFRALVNDMSEKVRTSARSALHEGMGPLEIERAALAAFLHFLAEHKEIYRIIDEAEFVEISRYVLAQMRAEGTRFRTGVEIGADITASPGGRLPLMVRGLCPAVPIRYRTTRRR